jgi:hypothetical protein
MDLPRSQLSAEQRLALADFERRAAEAVEAADKARRGLETERRQLETEIQESSTQFDTVRSTFPPAMCVPAHGPAVLRAARTVKVLPWDGWVQQLQLAWT